MHMSGSVAGGIHAEESQSVGAPGGGASEHSMARSREPWKRRVRVLVAEDHEDTREALKLLLELEGYEVHAAKNGREALATALEIRPDVVITDFDMPEMDGASLSRALRSHSNRIGRVPIVVLTALGWSLIQRAMEAGADMHIPKPVDFHVLGQTLDQVVRDLDVPADAEETSSKPAA
jgi:CheY-like chemotaxis protein